MRTSMASPLPSGKRKMLSSTFAHDKFAGESVGTKVSDADIARMFGRLIARTLEIAGRTRQDVQGELDYANQSPVSKLINPVEASPFARLLAIDWFADAYLEALAEKRSRRVRVKTVIEIERVSA